MLHHLMFLHGPYHLSLYRVQPVAAGCIIGWDAAFAADAVSPYQYTGAPFADLGRMTG